MKKILQINVSCNRGSTGHIAEECNKAAASAGFDCRYAYGRSHLPSEFETYRIGNKYAVYEHYLENRLFCNEGGASRRATKHLVNWINEWNPDIVHLHNIHDHYLNYKILFGYLNKTDIKVVWTFHDFWAFTGLCCHFVPYNCEKWKTECSACPMAKNRKFLLMDRTKKIFHSKKDLLLANNNLHIVAVSDWVGDLTKHSFLKNKDIRVIPNGVDLNIFKPSVGYCHPKIQKDTFVIMAVASQWQGKGLTDYIAMSQMLNDDEVIVLVGVPDEVIATLPENIIGIRRTNNQQELATLYTRANVITSFSSAETFGLTIVEGYACGTPAVVYDNTAPPSMITPETGFVVPNKNYKAAYEAILKIKTNGKDFYSNACIQLARNKYDKTKCFTLYVQLYNELLNI